MVEKFFGILLDQYIKAKTVIGPLKRKYLHEGKNLLWNNILEEFCMGLES